MESQISDLIILEEPTGRAQLLHKELDHRCLIIRAQVLCNTPLESKFIIITSLYHCVSVHVLHVCIRAIKFVHA